MNAASFVGRISPGFFARRLGLLNMIAASNGCGAILIFSMIAVNSVAGVVVFGVLYGFISGVCKQASVPSTCLADVYLRGQRSRWGRPCSRSLPRTSASSGALWFLSSCSRHPLILD
jgi:hypothetical protein